MTSLFIDDNNENLLGKYLLVEISNTTYAFPIEHVTEVMPTIDMFTIDNLDNNVTGLINIKGEIVPVYDLRAFLGKEIKPLSVKQKFLRLKVGDNKFAIIIDNAGEIVHITDEMISKLQYNESLDFLKTVVFQNNTVIIIDVDKFAEYTKINRNINKMDSIKLPMKAEYSHSIQNRMMRLNQNTGYELQNDSFVNEKFIIFRLEEEIYTFNINYVKKIKQISLSAITQIPCVPDFVLGIINFRGVYTTVLNIKSFLNIQTINNNNKDKVEIAILDINNLKIAFVVDEILDITNLPIANLSDNSRNENSFIIGDLPYIDNKMVNMLNVEKLFSEENINIDKH